ncbi:MAG: hypothetical protein K6G85_09655, partial [Eubacterium sp.]|nr:hypothetical protein [Eubacterium sp.]
MKKYWKKVISIVLVFSLSVWGVSGYTKKMKPTKAVKAEEQVNDISDENLEAVLESKIASASEGEKQETVYVEMTADGEISKTIVSNLLKNPGEGNIEDYSELDDIENLSGEEKFTKTKEGKMIWENKGRDITYQGTTTKALPVQVKIQYFLDGKEMTAKEIAGKSGKVKIVYTYINKSKEQQGKYIPFLMLSGMILEDNFSNVTVDNGKVIAQEGKNIVVGYGIPGLKDYLIKKVEGADRFLKNIELPEAVTITADV